MDFTKEQRLKSAKECKYNIENINLSVLVDYDNEFLMPLKYQQAHPHSFFKVFAVSRGEVTVYFYGSERTLRENDVIIVSPGVEHNVRPHGADCTYFSIGFLFSRNTLRDCRDYYKKLSDTLTGEYLVCENAPKFTESVCRCFESILFNRKEERELAVHELILRIMADVPEKQKNRTAENDIPDSEMSRIHKVNMMIFSYYDRNITLEDVAKVLYLSPRQINRIIQNHYGMKWRELLVQHRMKVALWCVANTDKPIEELAEYVGYHSVRGFYYAFEKAYKKPPQFYRGKHDLANDILEGNIEAPGIPEIGEENESANQDNLPPGE